VDTLLDPVLEPFRYGFMVRALAVAVLVGIMCPILGAYVVTRGLSFMGDALAHAVLPGMVGGYVVGLNPLVATVPTAAGVAFLIGFLSRRTGVSEDVSIGILFAGLFALGLALLTLAEGLPVNLEDLLLGQVLGVSRADVLITGGLAVLVLAVLYGFHKELVFASFDPAGAAVAGLPTGKLDYLLLLLLALVIVIALQAVGIVLVMAMLVTPAATAHLLVRRFVPMMALGAALGATSTATGLYVSFYLNIPSGPAMTLVAVALFVVVAAFRGRQLSGV
jgi:ABC-type Mn2+/Zn2+ transport system permease subunit